MNDRFLKGGYLLWVVVHIFMWVATGSHSHASSYFYPFTEGSYFRGGFAHHISFMDARFYDYTEFLTYLIVPVLLYFAYKLIRPKEILDSALDEFFDEDITIEDTRLERQSRKGNRKKKEDE